MKFEIPDKLAVLYNEAAREYFKAMERFKRKHNREWNLLDNTIAINWSRKQRKAWNEFAKVFNAVSEAEGPFHVNDFMDDYLVKNAPVLAAAAMASIPRCISLAAGLGALYVLLRGLKGYV